MRWSADGNAVLYACGKDVVIASLAADAGGGGAAGGVNAGGAAALGGRSKVVSWKAHDGVVLAADWHPLHGRIVTAGEDCRYRVWDAFGRQLFASAPFDAVVTSVAWAPSGEHFAVGSFNSLRLCDKSGFSHSREKLACGSINSLSWAPDGTVVAGGAGNGAVVFGSLLNRSESWGHVEATLTAPSHVRVVDAQADAVEELDFRDAVLELAIGHNHLVVATATQCHVYTIGSWTTPHIFDLRAPPHLVLLTGRYFAMADAVAGLQVYTYEGRPAANPKFPGLRPEFLSRATVSLCNDAVAIVDRSDGRSECCRRASRGFAAL